VSEEIIEAVPEDSDDEVASDSPESPSVGHEVDDFVRRIESLAGTLPRVMFAVQSEARGASERFNDYAAKFGTVAAQDEHVITYSFKPPYDVRAAQLSEREKRAGVASELLPTVLVLALVGQFDAFVGRLLRVLFLLRPELIEASERSLTFSQLMDLGSIEAAREYVLEKEIETVLRKSHPDQFTWMENKFKIELRKGLPSWKTFVELTERRNLFAHTNGIVSDQYLINCREHEVEIPADCIRGTELAVDPDYFRNAYSCMLELGVKLSQVLWRKLIPEELENADDSLNEVAYSLIIAKRYELAVELLDFGCCVLKKHSSEQKRKVLQINRAQAYKWMGDEGASLKVLESEDWSACGLDFQLAIAVLKDEFDVAAEIMRSIGDNGDVNETAYQEWPLFQEFRKSEEFLAAFEQVFGEPFFHLEQALRESELAKQREALEALKSTLDEDLDEEAEPAQQ